MLGAVGGAVAVQASMLGPLIVASASEGVCAGLIVGVAWAVADLSRFGLGSVTEWLWRAAAGVVRCVRRRGVGQ